ncbi:unnamed protein product [Lactuca saligna]|uniref:Major facilitator superfamily (MFS) profile domain-containing protein n=1 Tax=Lactuca saligna TaxID=75948 RepID=A0AA35V6T8_LACSI|nr:unnamed protein product [Lactuca saligna]
MGDSETVIAQSSAIQEHPSTTVNRDLAASTGIDTMDVVNVIPDEDDQASIQGCAPKLNLFTTSGIQDMYRSVCCLYNWYSANMEDLGIDSVLFAGLIPCAVLLVGLFFVPESPRWLCTKETHRLVDCETVSKWIMKKSAESENMYW